MVLLFTYMHSGDGDSWTKFFKFLLVFEIITTCGIENLTAQIHGLYNCHQVILKSVSRNCHVLQLSFSVTPVLSTEFCTQG